MARTNLKNDLNLIGGYYLRDGSPISFSNVVIVRDASDLANIDSTKSYMLDGIVDMGSAQVVVPAGGISLSGLNGARDTAKIISSAENYTMFVSPDGGYSGDVVMESMTIEVTGAASSVFDLDNDGNSNALDVSKVNFIGCTSLGALTDYRQMLLSEIGFIGGSDGLTFNGTWTGLAVLNSIAVNFPAATLFKEGASLTFGGSVRANINFLDVNSASVLMDFDEANILSDAGVLLSGVRTTAADAMPNLPGSSVKVRYAECQGIRNTYIGGQWVISSATATIIGAPDTPVKLAGTTTYADLQWFTNGGGNNSITYISDQTTEVEIKCVLTFVGTNGDQVNVHLRQWDDSASDYIDLSESGAATLNASGRAEGVASFAYAVLDENDRVEVWVENLTAGRDVTAQAAGLFAVTER